jgi:hypothetical protein
MIVRNRYDTTGSAQALGQQAEDKFIQLFEQKGWKVTPATKYQDVRQHLDYFITKGNQTFGVDVKSEKRINRKDTETQNKIIFLEYLNVRGDSGWLYGKADFIAFQDGDTYLMIPREKLLERADLLVTDKRAKNAADSLYKLYTRFGRQDLITSVKRSDIEDLHTEL